MPPTADDVIRIARLFSFVREAQSLGQNRGQRVEAIQKWSGGQAGDSWCCQFATMVLDIAYQGDAPIPRLGACQAVYDLAKRRGMVRSEGKPGDLFLYVDRNDHAHHIGIVTDAAPLTGIAGNTSEDGRSSNGDGVYEHGINARVFVRYL